MLMYYIFIALSEIITWYGSRVITLFQFVGNKAKGRISISELLKLHFRVNVYGLFKHVYGFISRKVFLNL